MSARVEIVPLSAVPEAWAAAWDALASDAAEPNPFAERWFMSASCAHLAVPDAARMVAVWDGTRLIALFPVCIAPRYGRMPVRHVENWLHYHSFLGTPLMARGHEQAAWTALLGALDEADWAPAFLHLVALSHGPALDALQQVRRTDIVHRTTRAMLESGLSPEAYFETHVRAKKRKELRRLRNRLEDHGVVHFESSHSFEWVFDFLALEASGWKGRDGSALARDTATDGFAKAMFCAAAAAGRLEMQRLTLDGRPIAMLAHFRTPPGSFSYKIAFDEAFARYSPGVLIQLENLKCLADPEIDWMDSCAVEDHAMINGLWGERREIVRVTVPLKGVKRRAAFAACRTLERASAIVRRTIGTKT